MTAAMSLIEIAQPTFDVALDIRYATPANITGRSIYSRPVAYLRQEAAQCLAASIQKASETGHKLAIFDAFRPIEAQNRLWQSLPDARFVSDPRPPFQPDALPHPRGVAVDLGLIDRAGRLIDMGTGFDAMVPQSAHGALGITQRAADNRLLLRKIMEDTGWQAYEPEWWHYQLPEIARFTPLADSDLAEPMMA